MLLKTHYYKKEKVTQIMIFVRLKQQLASQSEYQAAISYSGADNLKLVHETT